MFDRPWKVLIIDDSPEDRTIVRRYLSHDTHMSYQFCEVPNGKQALAFYDTFRPDCIVLDYNLPDMNGIMFLQFLYQQYRQHLSAVIFLTGSGNEEIAVKAMKQGAQDYLVKDSITPESLQRAMVNAASKLELLQQLEQQHESFQILAENSPDSITRLDREFRYLYVNPAIIFMTGLQPKAFIGKTNQELDMPPHYTAAWEQALTEVVSSKQSRTFEYSLQDESATSYWETQLVPEFDAQHTVVSILGFTRDITEHHKQMARKDEFIGLVSHELRTPLTAMKGNVQLAMRRLKQMQVKVEAVEIQQNLEETSALLQRAVHQLGVQDRLINGLLDVSRIEEDMIEIQAAPYDLLKIVLEVVEDQRAIALNRTIELDLSAFSSPLMVFVDQSRIGQVINNYITNALKYSDKAELVTVGVDIDKEHGQVKVWVKDNGPGLSAEQQQRVWGRFYQVKLPGYITGLGLGLYICRTLIALQDGTVGVESAIGEGSTFWFQLPLTENI